MPRLAHLKQFLNYIFGSVQSNNAMYALLTKVFASLPGSLELLIV